MAIREELVHRLGRGAGWRSAQNEEHPDDEGNRRSRDALTELAGHVSTLPAEDRRFEAIAALHFSEDAFSPTGDEVDRLIARYGSNRHLQPNPDSFLRELVGIADRERDASRRRKADVNAGVGDGPEAAPATGPAPAGAGANASNGSPGAARLR